MELAPYNITVNGVAPTFIRSDRIRPHLEREEFRDFILRRNPLNRIGDPIEVVGPVIACHGSGKLHDRPGALRGRRRDG